MILATKRRKGQPATQTFLWLYHKPKNVRVGGYESNDPKKEIWGERDTKRENRRFASILKKIDALERKLYVLLSKEGQPVRAQITVPQSPSTLTLYFLYWVQQIGAQMTIATTATRTEDGLRVVMSLER